MGPVFMEEGVQVAGGAGRNVLDDGGDLCTEPRCECAVELQREVGVPLGTPLEQVLAADMFGTLTRSTRRCRSNASRRATSP